jgi:carnitine O-acetyltransferase
MIYETKMKEQGVPQPAIFADPGYKKSSHWNISTSHCGSASLSLFGFGPVVGDGYGVGYMIKNNSISFVVTSKYNHSIHSSTVFCSLLQQSLLNMQTIVLCSPEKLSASSTSLNFTHPTSSAEVQFKWAPKN